MIRKCTRSVREEVVAEQSWPDLPRVRGSTTSRGRVELQPAKSPTFPAGGRQLAANPPAVMRHRKSQSMGPAELLEKKRIEDLMRNQVGRDLWVMNNHKWALWAWYSAQIGKSASLLHLDWHWDGVNDFQTRKSQDELLNIAQGGGLENLIEAENERVKYDSFIAPAIILGLVKDVHYHCFQNCGTPGLDLDLLESAGAKEYRHDSLQGVLDATEDIDSPILFDLDLDLFSRDTVYFQSEDEHFSNISDFLTRSTDVIQRAAVVTIAKSPANWKVFDGPQWDWTEEMADQIFDHVVPRVIEIRSGSA